MYIINTDNFVLYLKEAEFRYILSSLNSQEKENKIKEVFEYVYNTCNYDFLI